jgi:GntR family transcriptional regulator / MocR family aminotransferase
MTQATCQFVLDDLRLTRSANEPLQEQILVFLRRSIRAGRLAPGSRMPSSRELAATHGISRTTVVEVYSRLEAEGYMVTRPRAGCFVTSHLPQQSGACGLNDTAGGKVPHLRRPAHDGTGAASSNRRAVDSNRETLDHECRQQPLAPGIPAVDRFPWRKWTRLSAQVFRRHTVRAFSWADPRGERPLREAVAEYLSAFRGLPCHPDQVVIANGSQTLVELLMRTISQPGDRIWFEEPGDPASRSVLQGLGLVTVGVPVDEKGLDVEQGLRIAPDANLALVATSHHYPLTVTMSMQRRRALLDFSAASGAWIIENEIDGDFRFGTRVHEPLYTLDQSGRVIFLGSFNKSIAPGLRLGYAVVPESLAPRLKLISSNVSVQQQLLLAKFWTSGHLATHLRELRTVHARRRMALLEALRTHADGLLMLNKPAEYGLRIATRLRPGIDDVNAVRAAHSACVRIGRPISTCYAGVDRQDGLTIGFASTPTEKIAPAVQKLARAIGRLAASAA